VVVLIALSALTDAIIYAYDGYLAQFGRGTLSLVGGVAVVFVVLALLLFARPSLGFNLTLVLSLLWLLGQLGNAFSSGPSSATFPHGFTAYILGYGAISANAVNGCPYGCPPFGYSALASIVLQIPLLIVAFLGRRSLRRQGARNGPVPAT